MAIKIGELAKRTGCKVVTARYYEKEGLLRSPSRTRGNYRLYDEDDVERLQFIMHCRRHNISLDDIRRLLSFRGDEEEDCGWINDLLDVHIADIERQIASLTKLEGHLKQLRASCTGVGSVATCNIMQGLVTACSCSYRETSGI